MPDGNGRSKEMQQHHGEGRVAMTWVDEVAGGDRDCSPLVHFLLGSHSTSWQDHLMDARNCTNHGVLWVFISMGKWVLWMLWNTVQQRESSTHTQYSISPAGMVKGEFFPQGQKHQKICRKVSGSTTTFRECPLLSVRWFSSLAPFFTQKYQKGSVLSLFHSISAFREHPPSPYPHLRLGDRFSFPLKSLSPMSVGHQLQLAVEKEGGEFRGATAYRYWGFLQWYLLVSGLLLGSPPSSIPQHWYEKQCGYQS